MGSLASSSTTQKAEPWGPTARLMRQGYKDLSSAYTAMGNLPTYKKGESKGQLKSNPFIYTEPTFAAYGEDTTASLDGMRNLSAANSNGAGMSGSLQSIMSNGGLTGGQSDAIGGMKQLANNGLLNELINGNGLTGDQNKAFDSLKDTVYGNNQQFQQTFDRGGFDERQAAAYDDLNRTVSNNNSQIGQTLNQGGMTDDQRLVADRYRTGMNEQFAQDPTYQRVKQQGLDAQADALSARAASAGRYGGGMDQAILAREQGNLSDRMDVAEMDKWRARTDASAGNLAGLSQQGLGNQLGINSAQQQGYQNLGNFGQIGQGNQLAVNSAQQQGLGNIVNTGATGVGQNSNAIGQKQGLLSSIFNSEQAGLGNMGTAYDTATKPLQTQAQVGAAYDAQDQNVINDKMRMFDAANPMNNIQNYLSTLLGAPRNSTTTSNPSSLQMLLGGGIGGYGLLNSMGMFGGAPAAGGGAI